MKVGLRVPFAGLTEGRLELPTDTAKYVFRVHRLRVGAGLQLFDPEAGVEASATVEEDFSLRVGPLAPAPVQALPIHLFQGVGKADKPEQVVRDVTVLGAERLTLLHSSRSVAKSESDRRRQRLHRVAVESARQCGRGRIPELLGPLEWEDGLARAGGELRVACVPKDGAPALREVIDAGLTPGALPSIDVLIGPEGGLLSEEVQQAEAAGFVCVGLGPLVLRTETAATAVLGFLRLYLATMA